MLAVIAVVLLVEVAVIGIAEMLVQILAEDAVQAVAVARREVEVTNALVVGKLVLVVAQNAKADVEILALTIVELLVLLFVQLLLSKKRKNSFK